MTSLERCVAISVICLLIVGFLYSGLATVRLGRAWMSLSFGTEPNATIDANLAIAGFSSDLLRQAVRDEGWAPTDDVVVLASSSDLSASELTQIHFSASYLLFPRRVWAATWCDSGADRNECHRRDGAADAEAAVAARHATHVLLLGDVNPFPDSRSTRRLSERARLVDLR